MPAVCLYFHVHQPLRLRHYSLFDIGRNSDYFDDASNKFYLERVNRKCYIPTNKVLLDLIEKHGDKFKFCFSITGVFLDQLEESFPETVESFQKLVDSGNVELFDETYYHSLAYLVSEKEFVHQVKMHSKKFKKVFGVKPKIFRNTEAMYSNQIAKTVSEMNFKGIVSEGLSHVLGWRSPNYVYKAKGSDIKVLLRNYKLADDIAFRFSSREWNEWPLTADKYASWLSGNKGHCINLFMDYETFGEHQWDSTGIFDFLRHLPSEALKYDNLSFQTASEIINDFPVVGEFDVPFFSSWADVDRDLTAWLGNEMQWHAFNEIKSLNEKIIASRNPKLISDWRKLQISDHFYYMCTKWFADGDVHKYFNPYDSPYESYLNFINVLNDLKARIN